MSARHAAPLLLAAILGIFPAPARAAEGQPPAPGQGPPPRPVRLDYQRGPGVERCPDEQAFRDAAGAQAISSADLFAPEAAARLAVTLRRRGFGYEGTVTLYDAAGAVFWTRTLPPPTYPPAASCPSLVENLAFSATNYIDPVVPLPLLPAPSSPPPPPSPRPPPPPPPPVTGSPVAFRFGAAAWADLATAPRPAFGLSFGLGFRVSWFSLEMEGRWDPPAGALIEGADLSTKRFVGALVPCGHKGYFVGCALTEVGPVWASIPGTHTASGGPASALFVAIGGRLGAEIPIAPHLILRPAVDLLIALQHADIHLDTHRRWEMPTVAAGFGVGLLASF
jgi:hypothetical protein